MKPLLLSLLRCPECRGPLLLQHETRKQETEIDSGDLNCEKCHRRYPIVNGIPRFVPGDEYAGSFGYQWNRFRREQIDSFNGSNRSQTRFEGETRWQEGWLKGKLILEAGCGAGRFLEVSSRHDCEVVGVDISSAVEAASETLRSRANVHIVQASIYQLPFASGTFDGCYCIGVLQHTPEPLSALSVLPAMLKKGGRLAVTVYERKPWTPWNAKYLVRPLTKRMDQKLLLRLIQGTTPFIFPLAYLLYRIPFLGRVISFCLPVANVMHEPGLSLAQKYQWTVLDTFDMLSPQFDQPLTESEMKKTLEGSNVREVSRVSSPGLTMVGEKS